MHKGRMARGTERAGTGVRAAARAALLLAFSGALGCAGGLPVGGERKVSGEEPPVWVTHPMEEDTRETKAFVGTSLDMATEGQARTSALDDARKQIIDALGVYGERKLKEVVSSAGLPSRIIDPSVVTDVATEMVSEGMVRARAEEYHVEKWERRQLDGLVSFHKVYVLVHFSDRDAQEAVRVAARKAAVEAKDEEAQASIERALEVMRGMMADDEW